MFRLILALERRLFLFAPAGLSLAVLIAVLTVAAIATGRHVQQQTASAQAEFVREHQADLAEWREELVKIETSDEPPEPYAARPMNIRLPAVLPPAALAEFAVGSNDLHPTMAVLRGWVNPTDLFDEYEFANPTVLGGKGFDLTFLVIVLLPLAMIAASFDIAASERESGRARLIAVQAGEIGRSIWLRLVVRNAMVWLVWIVVVSLGVVGWGVGPNRPDRLIDFVVWLGVALAYGGFWFVGIAAANAVFARGETVAAALFSSWVVFVFVVPAVGGALAEATHPPPSRLAFLSEMRQGKVTAIRETADLTKGYLADHPELTVSPDAVPEYFRTNYLANVEAAKRTTPILEAFAESRAARELVVRRFEFLSPALMAHRVLTAIAGNDVARYQAFQTQARAGLEDLSARIGPAVVSKRRLSVAEFDEIPGFEFRERDRAEKLKEHALPLGVLIAATLGLLGLARNRLRAPLERLL
ncbi:MAG: DUF3526 domain-containing protein [Myxococcales bacterium FL481]|nr:MAG: DUF3526 domain-containing protein [Myxococcales bacterium FL481]